MNNNITYKMRVRKGEYEVELQGDKKWVESKFKQLTSEEIVKKEKTLSEHMPMTLGEFIDQKGNPQKHTELIAVFAYWLFRSEKMESFNVKDIIHCYDRTRIPKSTNPNQLINNNVRSHLFAEVSEKKDGYKAWVLTRLGEEYVEKVK